MTKTKSTNLQTQLQEARAKLAQTRLEIRAGKISNTNAHKATKKLIAQLLTQINAK